MQFQAISLRQLVTAGSTFTDRNTRPTDIDSALIEIAGYRWRNAENPGPMASGARKRLALSSRRKYISSGRCFPRTRRLSRRQLLQRCGSGRSGRNWQAQPDFSRRSGIKISGDRMACPSRQRHTGGTEAPRPTMRVRRYYKRCGGAMRADATRFGMQSDQGSCSPLAIGRAFLPGTALTAGVNRPSSATAERLFRPPTKDRSHPRSADSYPMTDRPPPRI